MRSNSLDLGKHETSEEVLKVVETNSCSKSDPSRQRYYTLFTFDCPLLNSLL